METSRAFMPLLTEFGRLGEGFCYKHVAPNGASAPAFQGLSGFDVVGVSGSHAEATPPSHSRRCSPGAVRCFRYTRVRRRYDAPQGRGYNIYEMGWLCEKPMS